MTLERAVAREKRRLERLWAELVYEGLWFSPLREAIDAFVASSQEAVTGDVGCASPPARAGRSVAGRRTLSTTRHSLPTTRTTQFDSLGCGGFVRLWGLPSTTWARKIRMPEASTCSGAGASRGARDPEMLASRRRWRSTPRFSRTTSRRRRLTLGLWSQRGCSTRMLWRHRTTRATRSPEWQRGHSRRTVDEDVHSLVERDLTERLGDVGRRIHAGRSRNDLVATDLRLWCKRCGRRAPPAIEDLVGSARPGGKRAR